MNDRERAYQPGFLILFAPIFLFGAAVGAGFTLALQSMGQVAYGVISYTFLQLLSIIYLWAVVGAYMIAKVFAVKLTGHAIKARTFWGMARTIEWAAVSDARPLNLIGFRFLRIYAEDGKAPLWIPLFMKKKGEFFASIRSQVPADHPVRDALP